MPFLIETYKPVSGNSPNMENIYRVQLVYRTDKEVHAIVKDALSYREAKDCFYSTNSGVEVIAQLINTETGEVIMEA